MSASDARRITVTLTAREYEGLKVRADRARRSLSAELALLVEGALSEPETNIALGRVTSSREVVTDRPAGGSGSESDFDINAPGAMAPPSPGFESVGVAEPNLFPAGATPSSEGEGPYPSDSPKGGVAGPGLASPSPKCTFATPRGIKCKSCGKVHK